MDQLTTGIFESQTSVRAVRADRITLTTSGRDKTDQNGGSLFVFVVR